MSGKDAQRGFIYQSIIAMIECLKKEDWDEIKLEPDTAKEKVDIKLYKEQKTLRAIQVKSSINPFSLGKITKWLEELKSDASDAEEICLCLVCDVCSSTECEDYIRSNPEIKKVGFSNLREICMGKLQDYVKGEGQGDSVTVNGLDSIYANLFTATHENSISSHPLTRDGFRNAFLRAIPNSNTNNLQEGFGVTMLTEEDLDNYYEGKKENLKWGVVRAAPSEYMKLYGICDSVEIESEEEVEYIDLLNLLLRPSGEANNKIISSARFKVIYGPSNSGLSCLCATAFQHFLDGKKTEFKKMAYFSISEEDIETIREKLTICGKSVFSKSFDQGLLLIDGLGKLFSDNLENIKKLINNISSLSENIDGPKVIITVRVNECAFGQFGNSVREDVVFIQNTMIRSDDEAFCDLMTLPVLNDSSESKAIFKNPRWFASLAKLVANGKDLGATESEIIDQSLHEGIGEEQAKQNDELNSKLAFEIFLKNDQDKDREFLRTRWDGSNDLSESNKRFLRIEKDMVGFKNSIIFEYYVALYLFSLFESINGEDSIKEFICCLSKKEMQDKGYNDVKESLSEEDDYVNHELILYLFSDLCLDKIDKEQRDNKINSIFLFLFNKNPAQSGFSEESQRACETAIKNFIKFYRLLGKDFVNDKYEYFRYISNLDSMYLPKLTCAASVLSRSNYTSSFFESLNVCDPAEIARNQESGRYRRFNSAKENPDKCDSAVMEHAIFKDSIIQKAEFIKTTIKFCDFEDAKVEECVVFNDSQIKNCSFDTAILNKASFKGTKILNTSFHGTEVNNGVFVDSQIENCSFEKAIISNASFKGTKIRNSSFGGMKANSGAFEDALYFKNGSYQKLSQEEWQNLGIEFPDSPVISD